MVEGLKRMVNRRIPPWIAFVGGFVLAFVIAFVSQTRGGMEGAEATGFAFGPGVICGGVFAALIAINNGQYARSSDSEGDAREPKA